MEEGNKDGVGQEVTEMVMMLEMTGQGPFFEEQ